MNLRDLVESCEENNRFHDAQWADWSLIDDIFTAYLPCGDYDDYYCDVEKATDILQHAIDSNGLSLRDDMVLLIKENNWLDDSAMKADSFLQTYFNDERLYS